MDPFTDAVAAMLDEDSEGGGNGDDRPVAPRRLSGGITILKDHLAEILPAFIEDLPSHELGAREARLGEGSGRLAFTHRALPRAGPMGLRVGLSRLPHPLDPPGVLPVRPER